MSQPLKYAVTSLKYLFSKLLGLVLPSMSPPAAKKVSKATTIALSRNPTSRGPRSGPAAYARAARRYNFDSPVFVAHAGIVYKYHSPHHGSHQSKHPGHRPIAGREGGQHTLDAPASEVPAQDVQNDLEYVVNVRIGTPGVTLRLDFDTGSSDLWVWSSELRSSLAGHAIYNPKKSSSAKLSPGATWNISYGDGSSASGNVYTDTIHIGDVTIPHQAVELAQKLSSSFLSEGGSDGLLGLAFPAINTVQPSSVLTPVANIIQQGIASGVFSVALDQGDNNGFYTFGGIDAAKAGVQESDITYAPVDGSQGFWMFDSPTATVNGKTVSRHGNRAIADTGTTLALVDDATVKAIYSAIPGARLSQEQGGWVYPSDAKVPTVAFAVGDKLYSVLPSDFGFGDAGNGMTFGGIQSRGNNPFDILGDVWLKSVYVVFDQDNVQIGVAQRSGDVA